VARILRSRITWIALAAIIVVSVTVSTVRAFTHFREQVSGLGGIALGDSQGEVIYKLGRPHEVLADPPNGQKIAGWEGDQLVYDTSDKKEGAPKSASMPPGTTIEQYPAWMYDSPQSRGDLRASFDRTSGRVDEIDCFDFNKPPTEFCPKLLGIGVGDSEAEILADLGEPSRQSIDAGVKTIEYRDIGVAFLLEKTRVYGIKVTGPDAHKSVPWRRFVYWIVHR
jgi:hypothetical protein